jgi:hypothetical protein
MQQAFLALKPEPTMMDYALRLVASPRFFSCLSGLSCIRHDRLSESLTGLLIFFTLRRIFESVLIEFDEPAHDICSAA